MRTIWKFNLNNINQQVVAMPSGAEILTVQTQNGRPCLWAMVDPNMSMTQRSILIYGTGHPVLKQDISHIGTYQLDDGALVFHVFEEPTQ